MPDLLHCGKRRNAYRRVDIRPPKDKLLYRGHWIVPEDLFESISVYEFHCPGCLKSKGMLELYGWVGHYYNHRMGKTGLEKIQPRHLDRWLQWMRQLKLVENGKGMLTVQGSSNAWPYTFRRNISIY